MPAHFSLISPLGKCRGVTVNPSPKVTVCRPLSPPIGSYCSKNSSPTLSPLINQARWAAGCDRTLEQFTLTSSPTRYLVRPPVMIGASSGRSDKSDSRKEEP